MMEQVYNPEGKTIRAMDLSSSDTLLLFFTDDTFFCALARRDYEDNKIEAHEEFDPNEFGLERAMQIGILSRAEVDEIKALRNKKNEEWIEERDRREWERLKKKYGG